MDDNEFMGAFGQLVNAMGGGGDRGQSFPKSDADDLTNGAPYIPGEVTMARRKGEKVTMERDDKGFYWIMPDGSEVR